MQHFRWLFDDKKEYEVVVWLKQTFVTVYSVGVCLSLKKKGFQSKSNLWVRKFFELIDNDMASQQQQLSLIFMLGWFFF